MASTILTRYEGKCADCGSDIPIGSQARYYGRGTLYGITCHAQKPNRKERRAQNKVTAKKAVKVAAAIVAPPVKPAHADMNGPANRCPKCGKDFMSAPQLDHHTANADRLCKPGVTPETPTGLGAFFEEWVLKCLIYRQSEQGLRDRLPLPTGFPTDRRVQIRKWPSLKGPSVIQLRKCIADAQVRAGDAHHVTVRTGERSHMNVHPAMVGYYLNEISKVRRDVREWANAGELKLAA
jgi:hypothetical protein